MSLEAGARIERTRIFTQTDFDGFARVSGDDNPIHVDPAFSARTKFGRTVSHGMLLYATFFGLIRQHGITGPQISQGLKFPNPTFTGEPVRFVADCVEATDGTVGFQLVATRVMDGAVVCEGTAIFGQGGRAA